MKYVAIGDIHGCYDELMTLMDKLPQDRQFIFLGDYIDRGPKSRQVVSQLIKWEKEHPNWVFLQGNHEDIFRDNVLHRGVKYGIYNWPANGGNATRDSYKPKGLDNYDRSLFNVTYPISHLEFLTSRPYYFDTPDYFFVHAGVVPGSTLEEQKSLLGVPPYSIENSWLWAREGFIDSDYDWGKKIIFGHTADYEGRYNKGRRFEPIVMPNKIGIDTACCPPASNKLTALLLPEEEFVFQEVLK